MNSPEFNEYLRNEIPYQNKDSIKSFSLGIEFFSAIEMGVSKNFSMRLDYLYSMKSLSYYYIFRYEYFYSVHQPTINAFYLINGKHFQLKFGGGIGFQYAQLEVNSSKTYKSWGGSLRGEIIYSAQLSNRLSSYISGFAFGHLTGGIKDRYGTTLRSSRTGKDVDLSGFGIGARLGLTVFLN